MNENFPSQRNQLLDGDICYVGFGVVVEGADGAVAKVVALDLNGQVIQLLAVQLPSDSVASWQQLKQQHAFVLQTDLKHEIFRMEPRLASHFGVFTRQTPRPFALNLGVESSLLIFSDNCV